MNNKTILLACAVSLGVASVAGAADHQYISRVSEAGKTITRSGERPTPQITYQYIYVTGSTAARSAFYAAVIDGTTAFDAAPTVVTQGSSSPSGASYMDFIGTMSTVATVIKCHWSGSEAGIADLNGSGTEQFLDDTATTELTSTATGPFTSSTVDLCMADNNVVYSRNPNAPITGSEVCVIPFKWEKEKGSAADLANVTDQAARAVLAGGARQALLTGNAADTNWVYLTGRNNQSGTRVNEFGDSGYGIFTAPFQLEVATNGAMVVQPDANVLEDVGYSSGGSVATQMGYDLSQSTSVDIANGNGAQHFSVIAYLGIGDATTAEGLGSTPLTYDGVAYSVAAVQQGQYNAWGNEYVYHKNTVSSQALAVFAKLSASTGISGHADGVTTINLTTMQAVRNGPTSDPSHL